MSQISTSIHIYTVPGLILTHKYIQNILQKKLHNTSGSTNCDQPDKLACHLIDDGGFLIATNQPKLNTSVSIQTRSDRFTKQRWGGDEVKCYSTLKWENISTNKQLPIQNLLVIDIYED